MLALLAAGIITCTSLYVHDGDSVVCDSRMLRLLGEHGVPDRLGVDTPELTPQARCAAEHQLGILAANRLIELLAGGASVEDSGAIDSRKRPLVRLRLPDGREAGQVLLDEGFAREWRQGQRNEWGC